MQPDVISASVADVAELATHGASAIPAGMSDDQTQTLPAVIDEGGRDPGAGIDWLRPQQRDDWAGAKPMKYTSEVAAELLRRHAQGETITSICDSPDMPKLSVWYWWLSRSDALSEAYAHARNQHAASLIGCAVDEAMKASDKESAQAAKVKADTLLRVAAMIDPSRWSERRTNTGATQIVIATNLGGPVEAAERPGEYVLTIEGEAESEPAGTKAGTRKR